MYLPKAPSALLRLLGLDDEDYCCYWLVSWSFPVLRTFVNVTEHHQDTTFLYVCNEEFMPQIDGIKVIHQQHRRRTSRRTLNSLLVTNRYGRVCDCKALPSRPLPWMADLCWVCRCYKEDDCGYCCCYNQVPNWLLLLYTEEELELGKDFWCRE